ncbi:hypothetical protein ALC56_00037, partial [Trachymyrmex septentrionalis]
FTALATPAASPTNDPRMPRSGRTGKTHFVVGSIRMLFFFFFSESRITHDNAFPRLLGEYIVSCVSFRESVALRIRYVALATRSIQ